MKIDNRTSTVAWRSASGRTLTSAAARGVFGRAVRLQQPPILALDGGVTFAGGFTEAFDVDDLDMPAAVVDEVRLLQHARNQRDAVAPRADHLRQRLLREPQLDAAGEVVGLQQASRQPGLHRMG